MGVVRLNTGFNIEIAFKVAAFHHRLLAWGIDLVVQWIFMVVISKFIEPIFMETAGAAHWRWISILFLLPVLFYHFLFEIFFNGQTLGKRIMKISVTTLEGGQPTISQYLLRWMFRPIDLPWWILPAIAVGGWPMYTFLFLFGGIICYFVSGKSQRIGDLLAGTLVIDKRATSSWNDTAFMELETDYVPQFPQVMRLSDRDINTIKQVLQLSEQKRNHDYLFRLTARICEVLEVKTNMDEMDFLETLLKDYNYLSSR